jgi:putative OPT family oligopeptide transporter
MENTASRTTYGLTAGSIVLGILITFVMTAANVYLGLYSGMTVSASIPAAVAGMGILRIFRQRSIHQSNIIQTMASAGESLAAGTLFTVPALVLVGAWNGFHFWQTTLIGLCGGMLGVVFMIPLRRALIVKRSTLTYPEGVACSAVLKAGMTGTARGLRTIIMGTSLGALVKFFSAGLGLISGSVEWARHLGNRLLFLGSDISPALLAVGYIVNLNIACLVFLGGAAGWLIGIPLLSAAAGREASALESAWILWSTKVRYIGVGAMITGGIWSIISIRKGIAEGMRGLIQGLKPKNKTEQPFESRDIPLLQLVIGSFICFLLIFWLYTSIVDNVLISLLALCCMVPAAFLFAAVSSYITGLVGSSNNPVSGMTISALLGTALFFVVLGFRGEPAILATLGVAAVVCCAACTAGDCSQDLKTGHLVGTSPRSQQYGQIIGVAAACVVIAPVLSLLHNTYGIGTGLKAPQATLFAGLAEGIFGKGDIPKSMVLTGIGIGIAVILLDWPLKRSGSRFRLYLMPLAVGIYLPFTLAVPIFIGGIIRFLVQRSSNSTDENSSTGKGVLFSSGLIAGEALMGVLIAVIVYLGVDMKIGIHPLFRTVVSLGTGICLIGVLYTVARRRF